MAELHPIGRSTSSASLTLGRKLDSIPFSPYHLMIIAVLGLVGFVDGYDLVDDRLAAGAGQDSRCISLRATSAFSPSPRR